jgi:hypothetical protein
MRVDGSKAPPPGAMNLTRTYFVSPLRRWLLWLVLGPIIALLIILGVSSEPADRSAMLLTAGLVFLIGLPFHFIVARTRLELGASGVRLRQTGYKLEAGWGDIEALDLTAGREGFVTRAPMAGKGAARLARFRFAGVGTAPLYDDAQQRLLGECRLIPIEAFAWHLRHGKMREDIARFAPHLAKAIEAG